MKSCLSVLHCYFNFPTYHLISVSKYYVAAAFGRNSLPCFKSTKFRELFLKESIASENRASFTV